MTRTTFVDGARLDQIDVAIVELSSSLVQKVEAGLAQQRTDAIETGSQARRQLVLVLPAAAFLTLLVAVMFGWSVTRSIVEPLSQLEAGARALAKGDFGHRVAIRGEDELAELGQVLNDSAQQLAVLYETLRSNEARFRLTIDAIPAFVWSALPDGSVDFINRRWLEFSGLSLEQGLGFGWEIAVHPDDRPHFLEAWAAAVASGKAMEFEARVRRAEQELLNAIEEAIERDRRNRQQHGLVCELRNRYQSLTAREQEVMQHVISGRLNKQIAAEMQITEFTVKIHRGHVMRKMCADSLVDLVRMAETLGIRPGRDSQADVV